MLEIILLDVLREIIHLYAAGHGAQGKNCCTVPYSALAIKGSLSVQEKNSNLVVI